MPKVREHNEHFQDVSLGGRKSCPSCGQKKAGQLYWWFEYQTTQRRTVTHFCAACFPQIRQRLLEHTGPCGCTVNLQWHGWGKDRPAWLTMEEPTPALAVLAQVG